MLSGDEAEARRVAGYLRQQQAFLEEEGDEPAAAAFLAVLQALLRHELPARGVSLEGLYAQALDRALNQLTGAGWKLAGAGLGGGASGVDADQDQPGFTTWEEVLSGRARAKQEQARARQRGDGDGAGESPSGAGGASAGGVADRSLYDLLGVPPTATAAEIKAAYRKLALQLHPDVSDAPDAAQRFGAVASAYDVLSSPESRALYDRYGAEGAAARAGGGAGRGNAAASWDEFRPHVRANKRTRARDASAASYAASVDGEEAAAAATNAAAAADADAATADASNPESEPGAAAVPAPGDVVEYPLSRVVMDDLQDGRTRGVGLLVGRNQDRGDAARLPPEALDLCEVEPLRQEAPGSSRWIPDELSPSTYPRLGELTRIQVAGYDPRFDVWRIEAALSEGCGGPELPEEVMV
jgi:hypothetical protein